MIQAMIFDLDGTLVQTERLKAISYAQAAVELCDDVEQGKPDPKIYLLVSCELDVPPDRCLVIEDSPSGVKAALAAGMWCIAVTTPFTHQAVHAERLLDERWIVDDPAALTAVVQRMVEKGKRD